MASIEVSVPVRICDLGGWTDTWFGGPGRVVNVAVRPGVEVSLRVTSAPDPVVLAIEDSDPYPIVPGRARVARFALVEAAIDMLPPPSGVHLEVTLRSAVPAGCGAGTSAAVAVALLAGLSAVRAETRPRREIAYAAHRLEVEVLGGESGIQDQLSAAFGGINYLEIDRYPEATVHSLPAWPELDAGLTLVFAGRAHDSASVHRRVIEHVADRRSAAALARLRDAALAARDAVLAQDLHAFGAAMIANTDAQRDLHPALVGADAAKVIELAKSHGAIGWKVNGAGGDGGSVTVLHAGANAKAAFEDRVRAFDPRYRVLPVRIDLAGLDVNA